VISSEFQQVLTEELPALIGSISFKKSMRWRGDSGERLFLYDCFIFHTAVALLCGLGVFRGR